ncbi:LytR/AlgR family response regulator transcription factor [Pedobacter africanus]|uniref:Two component transcriptional regulator, LytTR family n=1 Tax=Pedobacter africanus TaxID=151894 RepID=A0A1W2DG85_9SPHI|nr:LytTR family DNA-binding domain-containing protein [Pedobacter africanus]SMC96294.1 two component transcriptional regulator, LytTR family [Pedobacter africanus]
MVLNCIIVDDSKPCINLLSSHLIEFKAYVQLIKTYSDPLTALAEIQQNDIPDIAFIGILKGQISGIQLAKLLMNKIKYLIIIAYDLSYVLDAFDVNARGYLIKPILKQKLWETIMKIVEKEKRKLEDVRRNEYFFIKSNISEVTKIYVNDIIAVQGASNYVQIHTLDQKNYITYAKMLDYEHKLSSLGDFIRVNKSFIISTSAIKQIQKRKILLNNGLQIPIGNTYKNRIKELLNIIKL